MCHGFIKITSQETWNKLCEQLWPLCSNEQKSLYTPEMIGRYFAVSIMEEDAIGNVLPIIKLRRKYMEKKECIVIVGNTIAFIDMTDILE